MSEAYKKRVSGGARHERHRTTPIGAQQRATGADAVAAHERIATQRKVRSAQQQARGPKSECVKAAVQHPAANTNTNTNTKYTCDTGQTRNKLLAQWVRLTNHAAGHSRPGTAHLTA